MDLLQREIHDIINDDYGKTEELELYDYQEVQNSAVRASARRGNKRIISCMSTGSGKSAMIGDFVRSSQQKSMANKIIIVLPRRGLVLQLSRSFTRWGINHGVIMSGKKRRVMPNVQIISIDTYMSRLKSKRMELVAADLLIIDELQLQFTKSKRNIFENYKMIIALSATPVAPKGHSLGDFYDDIVETISMQELIDRGRLTDLKYYAAPEIDLSGLTKVGNDGDWAKNQLDRVMNKKKLIGDIVTNWERIAKGKPTVVFAASQSHARHLTREFCESGYNFEYMDCKTPDEDREAIFRRIESGETLGICNVGIIGVGIDIPCLEVCVLAVPTRLISRYLQCVGRVTRLFDGKLFGIVIDHAGIIAALGFPTDEIIWSLDGEESIEDRAKRMKEEKKEPKEVICVNCHTVFKGSRKCPACGCECIPNGKPIPVHEAVLVEVKPKKEKYSSEFKRDFYHGLLGYARKRGMKDGWAYYNYMDRFKIAPKWEKLPKEPGIDVMNWIKHKAIARSKGSRP